MAHKAVTLYQSFKGPNGWSFRPVVGEPAPLWEGSYYLSYSDGQRRMEPIVPEPQHALRMLEIKRLELALIAAGGQVRRIENRNKRVEPQNQAMPAPERKTVRQTVNDYLNYCRTRQGKT